MPEPIIIMSPATKYSKVFSGPKSPKIIINFKNHIFF